MESTAASAAQSSSPSSSSIALDASEHAISAVTVFPDGRAEVTRSFAVQLRRGCSRVIISNLPSCIDKNKLRVRGKGNRAVIVADVVYHPPQLSIFAKTEMDEELETLQAKKAVLNNQIKVMVDYGSSITAESSKLDVLQGFMKLVGENGTAMAMEMIELDKQIASVEQRRRKHLAESAADANENRARRTVRISVVLKTNEATDVTLDLMYCCESPSIKWSPAYDLRVSTTDSNPTQTVEIFMKAVISQATGEDWTNCAVTLSTVATSASKAIPRHGRVKIVSKPAFQARNKTAIFNAPQQANNVFQPQQQANNTGPPQGFSFQPPPAGANAPPPLFGGNVRPLGFGASTSGFGAPAASESFGTAPAFGATSTFGATPAFGAPAGALGGPPLGADGGVATEGFEFVGGSDEEERDELPQEEIVEFGTPSTVQTDSALGGIFQIEGGASIPSDSAVHKVSIATLKCQALVRWIAAPHVTPGLLFPGPVSIFLDDGFVADSAIKHVNLNEYFSCSLGIDPSVRVYHRDARKVLPTPTSAYAARTETHLYSSEFVVKNRGRTAVPRLFIKESLPSADTDSGVRVVLQEPKLIADGEAVSGDVPVTDGVTARWAQYAGGDKEGRLEFLCDVPAGKELSFKLEYQVVGTAGQPFSVSWS
ncbi:hypothetical protein HK405_011291 [Cladochytrium tenue]|nr:hypothetical protein HK405_011291 [Cladochytrium tenue]